MKPISINSSLLNDNLSVLSAGQEVFISGTIYTARDAAHKRLCECIKMGTQLPINLDGQIIYFVGPTPAKPNMIIGSAGPTTSSRMDVYSPILIEKTGLAGMIGKGDRSCAVIDAMVKHRCCYFATVGGAGALISQSIIASEIICYEDLGAEAIRKLTVKDFHAIVAIDIYGNSLYNHTKTDNNRHCA